MVDLSNEQIQQLKLIEFDLLKAVVSVCNNLKIKYFVVGGTLLGAVRHNGFIPWDDDIDIGMLRRDYEMFISKAQELLPNYCFLQNYHTEPDIPLAFTKIRNINTEFVESNLSKFSVNHGVFLDVFPLDSYPDNAFKQMIVNFINNVCNKRINYELGIYKNKNILSKTIGILSKLVFPNYRRAIKVKDKMCIGLSKKETGYKRNYSGAWGLKEVLPSVDFEKTETLIFEGLNVDAPGLYEDVLSKIYGNYMELPPIEQRCAHHYVDKVSL